MLWKLLWLLFLLAVAGYGVWSLMVLLQQKRAWKAFASKYSLQYLEDGFFSSPGFWGELNGKKILGYVSVINHPDRKLSGNWTFFDVVFDTPVEDHALIMGDTKLFKQLNNIEGLVGFIPNDLNWGDKTPVYVDSKEFFRSYLNREYIKPLIDLKKMKSVKQGYNFKFQPGESFVTFYSREVYDSPKKINEIIKTLSDTATIWQKERSLSKMQIDSIEAVNLTFEEEHEGEDIALDVNTEEHITNVDELGDKEVKDDKTTS